MAIQVELYGGEKLDLPEGFQEMQGSGLYCKQGTELLLSDGTIATYVSYEEEYAGYEGETFTYFVVELPDGRRVKTDEWDVVAFRPIKD